MQPYLLALLTLQFLLGFYYALFVLLHHKGCIFLLFQKQHHLENAINFNFKVPVQLVDFLLHLVPQ